MLTGSEIDAMVCVEPQRIVIEPYTRTQLNPNSYDLTLSANMSRYALAGGPLCQAGPLALDVRKETGLLDFEIPESGQTLLPNVLYLGVTNEYTESPDLIPMINGKSSLARLGVSVHQTGGVGDIGFKGRWTLEITVIHPVRIYPNMRVAQLSWFVPTGNTNIVYNGKYQDSRGSKPVGSMMHRDFNR